MSLKQTTGNQPSTTDAPQPKKGYLAEVYAELKKANWPTPNEGVRMTGIVMLVITIFTIYLFIWDRILSQFWHIATPQGPR